VGWVGFDKCEGAGGAGDTISNIQRFHAQPPTRPHPAGLEAEAVCGQHRARAARRRGAGVHHQGGQGVGAAPHQHDLPGGPGGGGWAGWLGDGAEGVG